MKKKIKTIWKEHKRDIIDIVIITGGCVLVYSCLRSKTKVMPAWVIDLGKDAANMSFTVDRAKMGPDFWELVEKNMPLLVDRMKAAIKARPTASHFQEGFRITVLK